MYHNVLWIIVSLKFCVQLFVEKNTDSSNIVLADLIVRVL